MSDYDFQLPTPGKRREILGAGRDLCQMDGVTEHWDTGAEREWFCTAPATGTNAEGLRVCDAHADEPEDDDPRQLPAARPAVRLPGQLRWRAPRRLPGPSRGRTGQVAVPDHSCPASLTVSGAVLCLTVVNFARML